MASPANGHFGKAGNRLNTPRFCSGPEPVAMTTAGGVDGRRTGEALEPTGASSLPDGSMPRHRGLSRPAEEELNLAEFKKI